VIPLEKQAIRLSPRDPYSGARYHLIGTVHLLQSRIEEAIVWLEKGRSAMPAVPFHHSSLASAYALIAETERAATELAEARRLNGGDLFSEHRPLEGCCWHMVGGAENPRLVRSHLFRRPAQSGNAGGVRGSVFSRTAPSVAVAPGGGHVERIARSSGYLSSRCWLAQLSRSKQ
jgi:hypothetical protein